MKYNFDEVIDRKNTESVKWDSIEETYNDKDLLPMWVADMDFKAPPEVLQAISERVEHGVFGYNCNSDSLYESIINWVKDRYNWEIKKEWIVFTPGVVAGFNFGIKSLTKESEEVIIQPPVYPQFFNVVNNIGRTVVENPLIKNNDKYTIDFIDLERKLNSSNLLLLCSPHNPVGRVWTVEELNKLNDVIIGSDSYIISDEIHCDLAYKDNKHTMIASISKEIEQKSITLIAPSKTFNLAGLFTSIAIIPNSKIRENVIKIMNDSSVNHINIFGLLALETAYSKGIDWLDELLDYIELNAEYVVDFIESNIKEIKVSKPEGTFLMWLDCRRLGLNHSDLHKLMIEEGQILLNDGHTFGTEGDGFLRLNIGCPRETLVEGLNRIGRAINSIQKEEV